jgi:hypothetical protein
VGPRRFPGGAAAGALVELHDELGSGRLVECS